MRVIIAGSRDIVDLDLIMRLIDESRFSFTEVLSGCARGVDSAALMKPWACPVRKIPADWQRWGNSAGFRRNMEMAMAADALIAAWDGVSPGTRNMVRLMRAAEKPIEVEIVAVKAGR